MKYRPRVMLTDNKRSPEGVRVFAIGVRVGYWPCLKAPFITLSLGVKHLDLWCGYPSYQDKHKSTLTGLFQSD